MKLEDLSRVPAETKAAVIQIVEQTKRRSGWRVYRTLAALGVPRSVFYAWRKRESLEDRVGKPCRVYELLPEERGAVCEFALQYPKIGYRKLTWMMVDAGVACVGENNCRASSYTLTVVPRAEAGSTSLKLPFLSGQFPPTGVIVPFGPCTPTSKPW